MKDSIATNKYSILKIMIPFLSIFVIPMIVLLIIHFIGASITTDTTSILSVIVDFSGVQKDVIIVIISILMIFSYRFIILAKILGSKVLYEEDVYGSYRWFWYVLAKFSGYRKISLIKKPYKIILLIMSKKYFDIEEDFNDEFLNISKENRDFTVKYIEGDKNQLNILISDTYEIRDTFIPKSVSKFQTYKFNRLIKNQIRVFSKDFIDEIGKVVNEFKEKRIKINLFMTTSVPNTAYFFNQYLLLGDRQFVHIEIFQMINNKNRGFLDKGHVYKRGIR